MNTADLPGPGDEATWPACAGHPGDPRTPQNDCLTEADARSQAEDEIERDPYAIAWWLNNSAIVDSTGALRISDIKDRLEAGEDLTAGELLVLAFNDAGQAAGAIAKLREQYREHSDTVAFIEYRVAELLAAEVERIEAMAELHREAA